MSEAAGSPTGDAATIAAALEHEHRVIDAGIEAFVSAEGDQGVGHLREALTALRRHIYLEEEFLFPPLREAGLLGPVLVMLLEHGEIWRTMDQLELDLVGAPPEQQRATCTALLGELEKHNAKEEPIVYPQADVALSEDARAQLHDFIANEEMPPGWVCQRA